MQDENKTQPLFRPEEREVRLQELISVLSYIETHADARLNFDQNGSRTVYAKFRESESSERDMHMVCTYFIASNLPKFSPQKHPDYQAPKSALKKKEYDILIQQLDTPLANKDFFSSEITRA